MWEMMSAPHNLNSKEDSKRACQVQQQVRGHEQSGNEDGERACQVQGFPQSVSGEVRRAAKCSTRAVEDTVMPAREWLPSRASANKQAVDELFTQQQELWELLNCFADTHKLSAA